jgi:hypothetical protein
MITRTRLAIVLFLFFGLVSSAVRMHSMQATPGGDAPKGQWGRVRPIADNNHPNLFYNQSEVDELRRMILVQKSPDHLVGLYNSMRPFVAQYPHPDPNYVNAIAAISYMIEPVSFKADAIRTTLLNMMNAYPSGIPPWWVDSCGFCGYSTAWMFDLIMAYHPTHFSPAEVAQLKNWFGKSSEILKLSSKDPSLVDGTGSSDGAIPMLQEGKRVARFPNWFARYLGPGLASALVAGNQDLVDYWADSGWPHDLFTFDGVTATYPSDSANRYDLVMYLLAVFPSGANTDTYDREGFRLPESDWYTTTYSTDAADGGEYHWAQMGGAILGAEMAYHNGMTGVFGITDVAGTEPALLRSYKRGIRSRTEVDRRPTSRTGHPITGYQTPIWLGYRRYSDPLIENAVSTANVRLFDLPTEVWQFLGYPRRPIQTTKQVDIKMSSSVRLGTFYAVDFSGADVNNDTHFDLRFRLPGSTTDQEAWNWQKGPSGLHLVPHGTPVGIWTLTGVRPHQNPDDHSGQYSPISATLFVTPF